METELAEGVPDSVPNPTNGIGTRIDEVAGKIGSRKKAAEAAQVSVSTLMRWITEESMPVFQPLARLAAAGGVSLDWIASGIGSSKVASSTSGEAEKLEEYAFVALYDAHCSAGHGAWNEGCRVLTHISFTRYSLRKKGLTPEHLSAIRIDGDSMEPVLHSGDTVLIDHTCTHIEAEGIYVLRLDGHLYAKRLQRNFDGVSIISANKEYREVVVPRDRLDELEVIGKAVWSAGWL